MDFLEGPAYEVAPRLLDCTFERDVNGQILRARIVETEAYDQTDVASHSNRGQTSRTSVMFGPAGRLYVYFTYGMHYCCNIIVGPEGYGGAVLIRAVEPLTGKETMSQFRGKTGVEISNGPAKLCQALKIDKQLNGHNLQHFPLKLQISNPLSEKHITQTTRVGISKAKDTLWRFYITDNPYVSTI